MLFKNLHLFRITDSDAAHEALFGGDFHSQMERNRFLPCGEFDYETAGWINPAPHEPKLYGYKSRSGLAVLLALKVEQKILPKAAINYEVAKRVDVIEKEENRKVGNKEWREIQEKTEEELLPRALVRSEIIRAIVDMDGGLIWVDTASPAKASRLINGLHKTLDNFPCALIGTKDDPILAMSTWLELGEAGRFTLDDDAKLQSPNGEGARITVSKQDLHADEIQQHLQSGKLVMQLGMTWEDSISFALTDQMQVKRLQFLEQFQSQVRDAKAENTEMLFDTTLELMVLQGRRLIADLITELNGLAEIAA